MPSSTLQKALGHKIRALRSEQGYSQEGFADLCSVHRTFMGSVERGETNISFQNLVKISAALKITLAELLAGVEKIAETHSLPPAVKAAKRVVKKSSQ